MAGEEKGIIRFRSGSRIVSDAKQTAAGVVPPMMANTLKEPFESPDWIFEIKLDGYRAIAVFDASGKPRLWSRNGLPLEQKFPAVAKSVSKLKLRSTILDGKIVAVDEEGIPRFQLLQGFQKQPYRGGQIRICEFL